MKLLIFLAVISATQARHWYNTESPEIKCDIAADAK